MFYRLVRFAIKVTGAFTYFNGFDNKSDSVCIFVLGGVDFRDKLGAVRQSQGPTVITCDGLPAQIGSFRETQKFISAQPPLAQH
jgi:hypothetical protein